MAYVHYSRKLIYLAHPRTASTATAAALKTNGFVEVMHHHSFLYEGEITGLTPETRDEWTVFTTIRNPYDAIVSWMHVLMNRNDLPAWSLEKFREMLKNNLVGGRSLNEHGTMWWHADDADHIIRFENFGPEMNRFLLSHGIELAPIQKTNASAGRNGRDYREFYTPETSSYIGDLLAYDIERFGYSF